MNRFTKFATLTVVATFLLIVIGAIVRATGSGMGCPDWPLCHGEIIPPLGDTAAWIEWIHRTVAMIVGLMVVAIAVLAFKDHRQRSIVVPAVGAVLLTGLQAWLGMITVATNNAGEWVTAHLAAATLLLALLIFIALRSRHPVDLPKRGASQRLTLVLAFTSATIYALILFGAHVTATGAALVFQDWPLFSGSLLPEFSSDPNLAALEMSHFLHRIIAAVVTIFVALSAVAVWRDVKSARPSPGAQTLLALVGTGVALFAIQIVVGALQIFTTLAPWAVALHLGLAAAVWGLFIAATFYAYLEARTADPEASGLSRDHSAAAHEEAPSDPSPPAPTARDRVKAYIALTKPRIIELLLITTVPAMVLAARGMPPIDLVIWTLIGGTLAAGSANAINCYIDRDIDVIMSRTRRRPLPAHAVEPEDALVFGLILGVISFALMTALVNLVAAFLTLVAIAFYVVIYTLLLKRRTPQNIVLGGAAGSLPPVIGWAAVTGDITLPALLLFAIVFYWTPPHFWALALRVRQDYADAGVPMLPVVAGVPETTRQIALYSVLMVAITLIFFAAARMGLIFFAGSLVLGGLFLFQAFAMWREQSDRRAVRLYKYSITYLTGVFGLIILDVAIPIWF